MSGHKELRGRSPVRVRPRRFVRYVTGNTSWRGLSVDESVAEPDVSDAGATGVPCTMSLSRTARFEPRMAANTAKNTANSPLTACRPSHVLTTAPPAAAPRPAILIDRGQER